ncbi:hypothetical protein ABZV65_30485 [Streptomyces bauhiniae]|uniref:hypothetical protein n=1 Tax=Streptomyces bauhiniae TaxID=2340725 RepID=UPI0033B5EBEC
MPVSLDKTPAPRPEDMDRAPAYRPRLAKLTKPFFVLADTTGQFTPQAPGNRVDILTVEEAADFSVERALQRMDFMATCTEVPSLTCLLVYASSAAQAAGITRRALAGD